MAPKCEPSDDEEKLYGNSRIKQELSEGSDAAESFQVSLAQFAFNLSPTVNSNGRATTIRRSPRNHIRKTESEPSNSHENSPRTGKRSTSALDKGFNQLDDRSTTLEPSSPSKKQKRGYAEPATYAHLRELRDYLQSGLEVVFCGINPGQKSAEIGHHFGGPTNHFWKCLHESGFTTRLLRPQEDFTLPEHFSIGMTNLVERPTAEQSELSKAEQVAGAPAFLSKMATHRPKIVCFVGLGIAEIVQSKVMPAGRGRKMKASLGIQPYKLEYQDGQAGPKETLFYALSSTSGRVVQYQKKDKVNQFKALRALLETLGDNKFDSSSLHALQLYDLR